MLTQYLIDRYRVVFDTGVGWHCVCAEFLKTGDCRHIRESIGRFVAQERIAKRTKPEFGALVNFTNIDNSEPAKGISRT